MKSRRDSDTTLYRLVFFVGATGDGADQAADGRRIAAAADEGLDTGTGLDDPAVERTIVDQIAADLLVRFPSADVYRWSDHDPDDVGITLTVDERNVELVVEPVFIEATLWNDGHGRPTATADDLQRITQAALPTGLTAVFDPQLDRLVTFPADAPAIVAAVAGLPNAVYRDPADLVGPSATASEANADAAAALGQRDERSRGGFFRRLLGRD
ncbi:MAG: hypothetical protein JHD16_09085 [Solirubrobacteraceae bacterium]|nr:hypothetical protein [Solirubrobacteraceae bacterium]